MASDGLWYVPSGYRSAGRLDDETSEGADGVARTLGSVHMSPSSWGGADAFVSSVLSKRDDHVTGARRARDDRSHWADTDVRAAGHGEEGDIAAGAAVRAVQIDTNITDAI
ncbi:hypothetical protein [Streptomyces sp. RFCAC02]|uniref:hypothetical protein n=1 Tax=Streptomyces sp. RFCAC02 TaxID=2499143 RepID=UPI0010220402|nr:hypothetical protein [Streptomyces sp. RFCAC02]